MTEQVGAFNYSSTTLAYAQWTCVGNCVECGAPFLANLTSITVPAVHKTCACVARPKRIRKSKLAADGLPRVEPDTFTHPLVP